MDMEEIRAEVLRNGAQNGRDFQNMWAPGEGHRFFDTEVGGLGDDRNTEILRQIIDRRHGPVLGDL